LSSCIISYRCFGATYWFHLQRSRIQKKTFVPIRILYREECWQLKASVTWYQPNICINPIGRQNDPILKLEFFSRYFRKIFKYLILEKSLKWKPSCSCVQTGRQTDRHEGGNSCFTQFCECAPKNIPKIIHFFIFFKLRHKH